ncbi:MAG: acetoacetate--CoA ligase [Gemmatimonadaceae bacterium]|nr:acetoacetate--CoA ligase [Gemmatimonadaceae bacterium]
MSAPIWLPRANVTQVTQLRAFFAHVALHDRGAPTADAPYDAWHAWSIAHPERFWGEWWGVADVIADVDAAGNAWREVLNRDARMCPPRDASGPRWFEGARLNFAENLLRRRDDAEALVFRGEDGTRRAITFAELARAVAEVAEALRQSGVTRGDRVAGFLPNIPEAVIAMLATASIGAVWSSCSPDFGVKGVLDRFGQIAPKVLFVADGYRYAGKAIDLDARVEEIRAAIGSIHATVRIAFMESPPVPTGGVESWDAFRTRGAGAPLTFTRLPFDHPLYVMYSSGTTGLPKCMVHGAGGTLLQHLKEHRLHVDLRADDRIFYFTTCGWMMWNWLVSALATGATVVLYDGAPMAPDSDGLWRLAAEERVGVFGVSAKFLALSEKAGVAPRERFDLSSLRTILSTGSPLAPHSYAWVQQAVGASVQLASISGGTDLISCFALGNPELPVYIGELQCLGLGMAVEVWDDEGHPLPAGEVGELVCTRPFPSMPVVFWNDPDGALYRAAYFDRFPGAWRHGDWVERTAHGGMIIHGRSDATLNPGGVRIGTAELYRQVEQIPEVVESVVIAQEWPGDDGARDVRIVLFVRLRDGAVLDAALEDAIRSRIRRETSPHHVPKVIVAVPDIPRTISGKISEIAVRDVVHGRTVKNTDALANPDSLACFASVPALATPSAAPT